jgi:hypothetical protein
MRVLKWLGVQLRKRPLWSVIVAFVAVVAATSLAQEALPSHAKAIEHVGEMVGTWLGYLVILILIIKFARSIFPKEMNTAAVVVAVVAWLVYGALFEVLVAILASSGDLADSLSWFKGRITGGIGGQAISTVAGGFLIAIPGLLIWYPQQLRRRLPWNRATELSRTLLPAWLAAGAAVITWAYILLLHLAGGPLATTSVQVLLVAGFGVATLLVPLYQFMARSCWQYGTEAVFDPMRWCAAVVEVHKEIKAAKASYRHAMLGQSTDTPSPRADSDPRDNGAAGP